MVSCLLDRPAWQFIAGAEHLHITQPAVSHTIKHLEGTIGGPLFFRTTKGVKLTSEGDVLFRYIEQAFSFIEIGEKAIGTCITCKAAKLILSKRYVVQVLFAAAFGVFPRHLSGYTHPHLQPHNPETLSLLKEGKIDFGIVHLPATDKQIDFRASSPIHDCLVAGKSFVERAQLQHPCPFAISGTTRRLCWRGREHKKLCRSICRAAGVTLKPEFELGSIELLVQFARSGFGLAFVIRDYANEELQGGQLIEVPLHPPIPERKDRNCNASRHSVIRRRQVISFSLP